MSRRDILLVETYGFQEQNQSALNNAVHSWKKAFALIALIQYRKDRQVDRKGSQRIDHFMP